MRTSEADQARFSYIASSTIQFIKVLSRESLPRFDVLSVMVPCEYVFELSSFPLTYNDIAVHDKVATTLYQTQFDSVVAHIASTVAPEEPSHRNWKKNLLLVFVPIDVIGLSAHEFRQAHTLLSALTAFPLNHTLMVLSPVAGTTTEILLELPFKLAAPLPILPQVQVMLVHDPLLAFPEESLAFQFKWYSPLVAPLPAPKYSPSAIVGNG